MQNKNEIESVADMHIIKEVQEVMDCIEAAGHETYAVGGSVRDALLGRDPYDWDLATDASAEIITGLFPRTAKTGIKFGIVKVFHEGMAIDVATYRTDGPYEDCRRPCHVDFTRELSEDLKRRDFTINAMAFSPKRGLQDPFNGQEDLKDGLIRTVGDPFERFKEDALRILRAVRFSGQLDFNIEKASLTAMQKKAELLSLISIERIREEFEKMIISAKPSRSLALCMSLGLFPYILGEAFRGISKEEAQRLQTLTEAIDSSNNDRDVRLSLLLLCFETDRIMKAVDRLKFDNVSKTRLKSIKYLVADLAQIQSKEALKKFISRSGFDTYYFAEAVDREQRIVFSQPDGAKKKQTKSAGHSDVANRLTWLGEIQSNQEPIFLADLAINGNDLIKAGVAKGANVGKVLFFLLDHVQLFPSDNKEEALLIKAQDFRQHP
jgi:tRNA nucleotidyltransferase (CCA-adding enzyme)